MEKFYIIPQKSLKSSSKSPFVIKEATGTWVDQWGTRQLNFVKLIEAIFWLYLSSFALCLLAERGKTQQSVMLGST